MELSMVSNSQPCFSQSPRLPLYKEKLRIHAKIQKNLQFFTELEIF